MSAMKITRVMSSRRMLLRTATVNIAFTRELICVMWTTNLRK